MQQQVKGILFQKNWSQVHEKGEIIKYLSGELSIVITDYIDDADTSMMLYIIDEKASIKERDWVYSNHKNKDFDEFIWKLDGKHWKDYQEFSSVSTICKIVATTDIKLITDGVPSISQEFLQEYVTLQGKGQIMMEYDSGLFSVTKIDNQIFTKLDQSGNAILSIVPELSEEAKIATTQNTLRLLADKSSREAGYIPEHHGGYVKGFTAGWEECKKHYNIVDKLNSYETT